jgi:hypothetical protein
MFLWTLTQTAHGVTSAVSSEDQQSRFLSCWLVTQTAAAIQFARVSSNEDRVGDLKANVARCSTSPKPHYTCTCVKTCMSIKWLIRWRQIHTLLVHLCGIPSNWASGSYTERACTDMVVILWRPGFSTAVGHVTLCGGTHSSKLVGQE